MELQNKKLNKVDYLLLIASVVFTALVFIFVAKDKRITFCDEAYTYMITNSKAATVQFETNVLYSREQVQDILAHTKGDGFIGMLKNVLSDKVHPPLYYVFMYFSSVLARGSFSKWIGLSVNMLFLIGTVLCLWKILYKLFDSGVISTLSVALYVLSQSTLSDMMLIRMYMTMTFFTAAFVYVNIELICNKSDKKVYPALIAVTVAGFLTQYYFAFLAFAFFLIEVIICIKRKAKKQIKPYFVSMVISVLAATIIWPFWIPCMLMNSHAGAIAGNLTKAGSFLYKMYDGIRILQVSVFQKAYVVCGIAVMIFFLFFVLNGRIRKEKKEKWELVCKLLSASFLYAMLVRMLTPEYLTSGRYYYCAEMLEILAILICVYTLIEVYVKRYVTGISVCMVLLLLIANEFAFYYGYGIDYYTDAIEYDSQKDKLMEYEDAVWIVAEPESFFTHANIWDMCIPNYVLFIDEKSEYKEEYAKLPEFSEADKLIVITRQYTTDDGYIDFLDRGLYYFIGTSKRFVNAELMFERNGLTYYAATVVE